LLKKLIKYKQLKLNQFLSFKKIKYMFIIVTIVKLMFRWVFHVPNVKELKL